MTKAIFHNVLKALVLICALAFPLLPATSHAGVAITQKLILIEGRTRFAEATLINSGDEASTYEMSWRYFEMVEGTGDYKMIGQSLTDFDLAKHMVFTPRRITVPPHTSQKVRLALRLNGEAPPAGDYRAHFEFRELPKPELEEKSDSNEASVGVKINVGFSIPVIYRVGEGNESAKIGKVTTRLNKSNSTIEVVVPVTKSSENYSVLGNLLVYYRPAKGPEQLVGQISNANLFREVTTRVMPVTLNTKKLDKGSLHVVLKDQNEIKNVVFDEKVIPIGQ